MHRTSLFFLFACLSQLLMGCSDEGSTSSTASGSSSSGGGGKTSTVVINEINATGEEWVELKNTGDADVDLQQFAVTDQLVDGSPNFAEAVRFQAGTSLAPGEYLLIVGKVATPLPGPQSTCLMAGGPATCYQAAWGISSAKGDKVFFLDDADGIIEQEAYPANVAPAGSSYSRLPDGTGNFAIGKPTPGAANAAQ